MEVARSFGEGAIGGEDVERELERERAKGAEAYEARDGRGVGLEVEEVERVMESREPCMDARDVDLLGAGLVETDEALALGAKGLVVGDSIERKDAPRGEVVLILSAKMGNIKDGWSRKGPELRAVAEEGTFVG